jgi:hypothetical protein
MGLPASGRPAGRRALRGHRGRARATLPPAHNRALRQRGGGRRALARGRPRRRPGRAQGAPGSAPTGLGRGGAGGGLGSRRGRRSPPWVGPLHSARRPQDRAPLMAGVAVQARVVALGQGLSGSAAGVALERGPACCRPRVRFGTSRTRFGQSELPWRRERQRNVQDSRRPAHHARRSLPAALLPR